MLAIEDIVEQVRDERGWSASTAERHRRAYIAFLSKADPQRRPTIAVDAIWHAHILWTRRYRQDCEALVGRFVDHEPDPRVRGRCTSPEQPDEIQGRANCTQSEPPPPERSGAPLSGQRAADCTPSGPVPPDTALKPDAYLRMAHATGS